MNLYIVYQKKNPFQQGRGMKKLIHQSNNSIKEQSSDMHYYLIILVTYILLFNFLQYFNLVLYYS